MDFWGSILAGLKEFVGWDGYARTPEGAYTWQHFLFVGCATLIMIALAVLLGLLNRKKEDEKKNKVLIWSAILIDAFELVKLVLLCFKAGNPMEWIYHLPLFLCSIQLITIPMAAFCRGRLKETALDFVFVFGLLGAMAGTWGAGNIYSKAPVLSFDVFVSTITHCISGFASLYIGITGMAKMKWKNMPFSLAILTVFCIAAYVANVLIGTTNYMFLDNAEGTPYIMFYDMVGGSPVFYPIVVAFLFFAFIALFFFVYQEIVTKGKICRWIGGKVATLFGKKKAQSVDELVSAEKAEEAVEESEQVEEVESEVAEEVATTEEK